MRTSTADSRLIASLRRRIKQFYERLNRREFEKCFEMLDPQVRGSPTAITLYQFSSSLQRFLEWCGAVTVREIEALQIHVNESNRLYNDRDFANVRVQWEDSEGETHTFKERWVRDRRGWWYTRSNGFVVPDAPTAGA